MKSRITKLLIFTGLVFILFSCSNNVDDLSQENAEFLLNEYDSLTYLYNQTDTCKVSVDSYYSEGYVEKKPYSFIDHVQDDTGGSKFYLPDSIYQVSLEVYGISDAIDINFSLYDKNRHSYGRYSYHSIKKKEFTNNTTVLNKEYSNCFIYDSKTVLYPNEAEVQSFVYNKDFGLIQLIMKDSTRFELIGAK